VRRLSFRPVVLSRGKRERAFRNSEILVLVKRCKEMLRSYNWKVAVELKFKEWSSAFCATHTEIIWSSPFKREQG